MGMLQLNTGLWLLIQLLSQYPLLYLQTDTPLKQFEINAI